MIIYIELIGCYLTSWNLLCIYNALMAIGQQSPKKKVIFIEVFFELSKVNTKREKL
jgi:hypothetical protein